MKKQGYYFVERILCHTYTRGLRFYTRWSGYSISYCTWEPVSAFILDERNVNEVFAEYCKSQDSADILQSAQNQARKHAGRRDYCLLFYSTCEKGAPMVLRPCFAALVSRHSLVWELSWIAKGTPRPGDRFHQSREGVRCEVTNLRACE